MSPFAYLPDCVMEAWPGLSPSEKACVGALASFFSRKKKTDRLSGCPGNKALLERSGLKREQTLSRAIAGLIDKGLIERQRRFHKSAIYWWAEQDPTPSVESTPCVDSTPNRGQPNEKCGHTRGVPIEGDQLPRASRSGESDTPNGGHVWGLWLAANRDAGRRDPVTVGKDTAAAKNLSKMVRDGELTLDELRSALEAYLGNGDDWFGKQGHPLSMLPGRLNAYLNGPPMSPEEAAAEARFVEASLRYRDSGIEERLAAEGKV